MLLKLDPHEEEKSELKNNGQNEENKDEDQFIIVDDSYLDGVA